MTNETRQDIVGFMQTVAIIAVVLFALLMVSVERPLRMAGRELLPFAIGVAGLIFVSVGLMAMDAFRQRWTLAGGDPESDPTGRVNDLVPLLFEIGLWALGMLYVVRLVEIARG